ncbi:MAG: hypothetical protein QME66_00680 [Candidatus Eisenbacteria bacterium]|nr:hypothetical protein [Candidatus Eisenbacteria bacterium]
MKTLKKVLSIIALISVSIFTLHALSLSLWRKEALDLRICSLSLVDCPNQPDYMKQEDSSKQVSFESLATPEKRERLVVASCYTHTGNKTYSGKTPRAGMIAIRFNSPIVSDLEMGDKVWLEGHGLAGVFTIEDRMPDKWVGRDIDVFVPWSEDQCREWGVNQLRMRILCSATIRIPGNDN